MKCAKTARREMGGISSGKKKLSQKALEAAQVEFVHSACPCCNGEGTFCCDTWRSVVLQCGVKTWELDGRGEPEIVAPLWPASPLDTLEMTYCPFCGKKWAAFPEHLSKPGDGI